MIASANSLYDTRQRSLPGPAMVREPMGARTVSTDAIPAPSGPEPSGDNDELRKLGERIAELAARINSAEARMMTLIAEFDRRGGWKDGGYSSCAEWLAWRTGTKIGTARERVRTARALERLPQTADALKHGTISYAKVRALTRVATPEREAELLEFARAGSAAKLERTVRMLKKLSRDAELTAEQARHRSRTFSVFVDGDGMYVVKGRLEPEVGAVLMRAVEAASDALFRREGDAPDGAESGRGVGCEAGDARPEPKQRRADAVGLLAERALAAGFGAALDRDAGRPIENVFAPETPSVDEERASSNGDGQDVTQRRRADVTPRRERTGEGEASPNGEGQASSHGEGQASSHGEERTSSHGEGSTSPHGEGSTSPHGEGSTSSHGDPSTAPRGRSGTRAERYQVMVHCDAATLAAEGEPGTLGSGRDSRFRGDVAAHGVRCGGGGDGACEGRLDAERGPTDAHNSAAYSAGARGAGPGMPIPRVRVQVHRGASREALGRRGRDEPPEHAAPLPAASSSRSRGAGQGLCER